MEVSNLRCRRTVYPKCALSLLHLSSWRLCLQTFSLIHNICSVGLLHQSLIRACIPIWGLFEKQNKNSYRSCDAHDRILLLCNALCSYVIKKMGEVFGVAVSLESQIRGKIRALTCISLSIIKF